METILNHIKKTKFTNNIAFYNINSTTISFIPLLQELKYDSANDITKLVNHDTIKIIKEKFKINNCVQVVGDVDYWDPEKIILVQSKLKELLTNKKYSHINYGFTGRLSENKESYGVNTMVSLLADSVGPIPNNISNKLIANIVDYHTVQAIENWKCTISNTCNKFICVGPDCRFGDDIIISDLMCNSIICIEGGIQSFRQVINMLILNRKIIFIYGCRKELTFFHVHIF